MYLFNLNIYQVIIIDEKVKIVEEIMSDLPQWFGVSKESLPLWVAKNDEETIGFISLKELTEDICEIHAFGVKEVYQDEGVGKKLYYAMEEHAKEDYDYIQVKALDDGSQKEFIKTIGFFKSLGFKKAESSKTMWEEWNPLLIMGKKI